MTTSMVFEFSLRLGKMEAAFEYLTQSFEWLAAESENNKWYAVRAVLSQSGRVDFVLDQYRARPRPREVQTSNERIELLGRVFSYLVTENRPVEFKFEFRDYPWPALQSVCRYWRHVAVHTSVLWSYIHASHQDHDVSEVVDKQTALFSTSLRRSGVNPLTIYLKGGFENHPLMFDLLSRSNFKRIRELRLNDLPVDFLEELAKKPARRLEVLVMDTGERRDDQFCDFDWSLPRLHTFVASTSHDLYAPVEMLCHNLRHLILNGHIFEYSSFRDFHALLASNSQLEDLILSNMWTLRESLTALDELPPLNMPQLRRLSIQYNDEITTITASKILEKLKLILPEGHAKFYSYLDVEEPTQYFFPLRKLFIGDIGHIVTTNGSTSLRMENTFELSFRQIVGQPRHSDQLDELWLWLSRRHIDYSDSEWTSGFKEAKEVKKVVLARGIASWLKYFSRNRLFPALAELQLHSQVHQNKPAILSFLKTRAQGSPIQTLRFVQDPSGGGKTEAFSSWKDTVAEFAEFVPHVIFEDPNHPPPRMELPVVCKTPSTAHSYWPSWEPEMYKS
ncbi:hypothetical protein BC835DRAFT_675929 [Cytidiella melzeri]|nr:hypothetical protein BC835DRAFT_675929 [Cytidiella melzeri]